MKTFWACLLGWPIAFGILCKLAEWQYWNDRKKQGLDMSGKPGSAWSNDGDQSRITARDCGASSRRESDVQRVLQSRPASRFAGAKRADTPSE